ncbi:MAG: GNAT family N-acetyltransferase [Blastocatellia bacterium]
MNADHCHLSFSLRPTQPDDEAFLYALYCSTRAEEMAAWDWSEAQQDAFLRLQFRAWQQQFRQQSAQSDDRIILIDERPAGRIVVIRTEPEIRLADITLLPEYRQRGIGSALIAGLQHEAQAARKPLRLHVLAANRAVRLYERLGFVRCGGNGAYLLMEWLPKNDAAT